EHVEGAVGVAWRKKGEGGLTLRFPGRNSTAATVLFELIGIGITKQRYTSRPLAGTENGSETLRTRSGVPSCHPSGNVGAGGRSFASPSGAPALTHSAIRSISGCDSRRSSRNDPKPGSAFQGGILRLRVTSSRYRARLAA